MTTTKTAKTIDLVSAIDGITLEERKVSDIRASWDIDPATAELLAGGAVSEFIRASAGLTRAAVKVSALKVTASFDIVRRAVERGDKKQSDGARAAIEALFVSLGYTASSGQKSVSAMWRAVESGLTREVIDNGCIDADDKRAECKHGPITSQRALEEWLEVHGPAKKERAKKVKEEKEPGKEPGTDVPTLTDIMLTIVQATDMAGDLSRDAEAMAALSPDDLAVIRAQAERATSVLVEVVRRAYGKKSSAK